MQMYDLLKATKRNKMITIYFLGDCMALNNIKEGNAYHANFHIFVCLLFGKKIVNLYLNALIIHELLVDHQRNYVTQFLKEERAAITHYRVCQRNKGKAGIKFLPGHL